MLLSVRWLKKYLHADFTLDELIETITMAGHEVEGLRDLGFGSGKFVVAEVVERKDHPDVDTLSLCQVRTAPDAPPLEIVCGAPNVAAGMKVVCALEGAALPPAAGETEPFVIKKRKVRGIESNGMLCSAMELGLGTDHGGIMALPEDARVGEPFDAILDLKITPNRPDCLSVLGMARDIGAMFGKKVFPPQPRFRETLDPIDNSVHLSVKAKGECPRYTCRLLRGVKVGPSPAWLRLALESSGLRPINNVVDVTNFVLMELGHPLHAFDFDRLQGGRIDVRLAQPGEKIKLLDERELELNHEELLIADAGGGVALAGIMGGMGSEVTDDTTNVLLECAYFDPPVIRRAARRHGLQTDSSYRFERGTDRLLMVLSLNRATQLIQELAGGEVVKGMLDAQGTVVERDPVILNIEKANGLLGLSLSSTQIADYLLNLGFEIRRAERDSLAVAIPSHRVDVGRDVDLIEEIARLHNYNLIPLTLPSIPAVQLEKPSRDRAHARCHAVLTGVGLSEAMNYSFISAEQVRQLGFDPETFPRVANPLTVDHAIMRPRLLPGLLRNAQHNQRVDDGGVALFELGKVWTADSVPGLLEQEPLEVAFVLAGGAPAHFTQPPRDYDYFDAKGIVETLLAHFDDASPRVKPLTDSAMYHPGRAATIEWRGRVVGEVGELHPDLALAYDLRGRVYAARLELAPLAEALAAGNARMRPIPRYQGSWRDLALVVDEAVPAGEVLATVGKAGGALVEEVRLFDVYRGEHVPTGKKSLALSMRLRSSEGTLTDKQISATVEKVVKKTGQQHGATLRS